MPKTITLKNYGFQQFLINNRILPVNSDYINPQIYNNIDIITLPKDPYLDIEKIVCKDIKFDSETGDAITNESTYILNATLSDDFYNVYKLK